VNRTRIQAGTARSGSQARPIGSGPGEAFLWVLTYVVLAALPLAVLLLAPRPASRGFWIEFGVALGFIALAMFGLQFALTARFRRVATPFGLDTQLQFHRQAGLVAFWLALAHPMVVIAAHPAFVEFLDPRASLARAGALWLLLGSMVVLIVSTLWRQQLGLEYRWWRLLHAGLGFLVVFIGLVHVLRVSHYVHTPWLQALWVGMTGAALALLVYARAVRPFLLKRKPYSVVEVRPERGSAWTLVLEPVGHGGKRFEAGQFAWLTIGSSPFSIDQHPFSFSSSAAHHEHVEFTIKELGNYTARIGEVSPGTRAYMEGPYGAFTLSPHAVGAVFIVGGVGITPVMSILRTLRDLGDTRPLVLVYANREWEQVIFRDELADLEESMNLSVVHVVERPPGEWTGESGWVDEDLLERTLPREMPGIEYFVCGPEPMMDVVEPFLLKRGVSLRRLNSERFNIA
jgi:predicted ferric reductase